MVEWVAVRCSEAAIVASKHAANTPQLSSQSPKELGKTQTTYVYVPPTAWSAVLCVQYA